MIRLFFATSLLIIITSISYLSSIAVKNFGLIHFKLSLELEGLRLQENFTTAAFFMLNAFVSAFFGSIFSTFQ